MDSRWLWAILLLIIVVLGGWYLLAAPTTLAPTTDQMATTTSQVATSTPAAPVVGAPVQVTYTDTGFSPKSITVVEGQTVIWTNNSSKKMWVASAQHPTHAVYGGTNKDTHCAPGYTGETPFDECTGGEAGATYSFTFKKAGTWNYHDHMTSTMFGSVIVTAAGTGVNASTTVDVL